MISLSTVLVIAGSAACFILCDTLAAWWGKSGGRAPLTAMLAFSPVGYLMFGYLSSKYPVALVSGWVNVAVAIGTVLVGLLVFKDELSSRQWLGLSLAFAAIVVLMTGHSE